MLLQVSTVLLLVALCMSQEYEWDHLVFTRQWPQGVCMDFNHQHEGECFIPSDIKSWTIHGIWPSEGTAHGPSDCKMSTPFDENAIKSLLPALHHFWPSYKANQPMTGFWKHEWEKHGRCASSLPSLSGEANYFGRTIQLHQFYDIDSVLSKNGIVPSDDKEYNYDDIMNAMSEGFGHPVSIQCFHNSLTGKQYIEQIEMCIGKDLKVMDCPTRLKYIPHHRYRLLKRSNGGMCSQNKPIYIPLIQHSGQ
ncbi:ribonuclease Oy-like [Tubulanus polymorphus]|uniref:ribonuclease Oy-like n=1 Tax=Tubulanus polymorphus TaxID=672921 RepID=UPI003DA1FF39